MSVSFFKKAFSLFLTVLLFSFCAGASFAAEKTFVFTDSLGRELTVPAGTERVAASGPLAQIVLFALCPDKLVGIAEPWDPAAEQYLDPTCYALPVMGQLYGGKGDLDPEALLVSGAEVVIDVGEAKGSAAEDLDALGELTGIPFVHIDASLSGMGETFRLLGQLLGLEAEAETLASYCEQTYEKVTSLAESVEKRSVLYLTGTNGLNVIARGSYHAEAIDLMCENAAVVDSPSAKGTGNETDLEQIMLWDPDVILFAPDSIYETVGSMEEWQSVSAIAAGNYYEVPAAPYNWMGFPPSAQRLLGMLWLGKLLYPEEAGYDLEEETLTYYRLFYHCELARTQYEALTARSF